MATREHPNPAHCKICGRRVEQYQDMCLRCSKYYKHWIYRVKKEEK